MSCFSPLVTSDPKWTDRRRGKLPPFTAKLLNVWRAFERKEFRDGYYSFKEEIGGQTRLFQRLLRNPDIAYEQPFMIQP